MLGKYDESHFFQCLGNIPQDEDIIEPLGMHLNTQKFFSMMDIFFPRIENFIFGEKTFQHLRNMYLLQCYHRKRKISPFSSDIFGIMLEDIENANFGKKRELEVNLVKSLFEIFGSSSQVVSTPEALNPFCKSWHCLHQSFSEMLGHFGNFKRLLGKNCIVSCSLDMCEVRNLCKALSNLPAYPPTRIVFHSFCEFETSRQEFEQLPCVPDQKGFFYCIENTTAKHFFSFNGTEFLKLFHQRPSKKCNATFRVLTTEQCVNYLARNSGNRWLPEIGLHRILNEYFARKCFGEIMDSYWTTSFPLRCLGFHNSKDSIYQMSASFLRKLSLNIRTHYGRRYSSANKSWMKTLRTLKGMDI